MKAWDEADISLETALVRAAKCGDIEFVTRALEAGADIHCTENLALRMAAWNGRAKVVDMLLAAGADIHANNDEALRGAARNGHTEAVRVLLAHGARIGRAAVLAAQSGHMDTVAVLEEAAREGGARPAEAERHAKPGP